MSEVSTAVRVYWEDTDAGGVVFVPAFTFAATGEVVALDHALKALAAARAHDVDAFAVGEAIDPTWVSFLVSKPPLVDAAMPRWIRILQPLLSGVFTVDNLDYVRRDAYMTGVRIAAVDVERLRHYSFIGTRGLTLYEPAVAVWPEGMRP